MSTKIYNGFRMKGVRSLDKAFHSIKALRKTAEEAANKEAAKLLANAAANKYDLAIASGGKPQNVMLEAYRDISDALFEDAKERKRCYFDLGLSVALAVTHSKAVIGIVYSENRSMLKSFMANENIVDYSYWNNTDEPDDVSALEWSKRRGHWNEVLEIGIPAMEMFNVTLVNEYQFPYPDKELVEQYIPTFEKRLPIVAELSTMEKIRKNLDLMTPGAIIRYVMNNPEYKELLEAETARLSTVLKKDLTLKDLQESN